MRRRTYMYRVTQSAVSTVAVGSYLIDYEDGPASEWGPVRWWSIWDAADCNFTDGWSADRLDRLCTKCREDHKKAALHGHAEAHGEAPKVVPAVPSEVAS